MPSSPNSKFYSTDIERSIEKFREVLDAYDAFRRSASKHTESLKMALRSWRRRQQSLQKNIQLREGIIFFDRGVDNINDAIVRLRFVDRFIDVLTVQYDPDRYDVHPLSFIFRVIHLLSSSCESLQETLMFQLPIAQVRVLNCSQGPDCFDLLLDGKFKLSLQSCSVEQRDESVKLLRDVILAYSLENQVANGDDSVDPYIISDTLKQRMKRLAKFRAGEFVPLNISQSEYRDRSLRRMAHIGIFFGIGVAIATIIIAASTQQTEPSNRTKFLPFT